MKNLIKLLSIAALAAGIVNVRAADEGKDVKLTGKGMCAKCELKAADKCQNVVQVKDGDKTINYFLTGDVSQAFHKKLCTSTAKVNVEGKLTKDGDKMLVAVTKIEEAK